MPEQLRRNLVLAGQVNQPDLASGSRHNQDYKSTEKSNLYIHIPRITIKYKKPSIVVLAVVLCCVIGFGVYLAIPKHHSPPLPLDITAGLPYPVYYAKEATNGYSLQPGTAKVKSGILFYTLANHNKKIFITEQNAPSTQVNLKSLPKYTSLDVPIGQAVLGTGLGNPSIVVIAPQSLIELTSNKGVTRSDIISVAQSLVQVQQT